MIGIDAAKMTVPAGMSGLMPIRWTRAIDNGARYLMDLPGSGADADLAIAVVVARERPNQTFFSAIWGNHFIQILSWLAPDSAAARWRPISLQSLIVAVAEAHCFVLATTSINAAC